MESLRGPVIEVSAGAALVRESTTGVELLVIRVRSSGYELPKGHLERDEKPEAAAARELREETGLVSEVKVGEFLGTLEYSFEKDSTTVHKRVDYFLFTPVGSETPTFTEKPSRTKEVRWTTKPDAAALPLVSEDLRPIMLKAFDAFASQSCRRFGIVTEPDEQLT